MASALKVYKPGQGYYTRVLTAVGAGAVVLVVVGWLWRRFEAANAFGDNLLIGQAVMAVTMLAGFGALLWWLLNKPNIVEFMIATEAEMKKVNWPSKREIVGSTIVVIGGTLLMALLLFAVDIVFGWIFLNIGIIQSTGDG